MSLTFTGFPRDRADNNDPAWYKRGAMLARPSHPRRPERRRRTGPAVSIV